MPNSRRIGKRAELQASHKINEVLGTNFRRSQQHKGAKDSPDIIDDQNPQLAIEVKRRKAMNLRNVVNQAKEEAAEDASAFVLHKKPREAWLLSADFEDVPALMCRLVSALLKSGRIDRIQGETAEEQGLFLEGLANQLIEERDSE